MGPEEEFPGVVRFVRIGYRRRGEGVLRLDELADFSSRCRAAMDLSMVRLQFDGSEAEAAAYRAEEEQAAVGVAQVPAQGVDGLRLLAPALGEDLFEREERGGL